MDRGGTSDPYVVLQVGDSRCQTKVIKKNLNPEWHEVFDLVCTDVNQQVLTISVFDKDLFSDDRIGQTLIPLSELGFFSGDEVPMPRWHKIYEDSVMTGQVLLDLRLPRPRGFVSHEDRVQATMAQAEADRAFEDAEAAEEQARKAARTAETEAIRVAELAQALESASNFDLVQGMRLGPVLVARDVVPVVGMRVRLSSGGRGLLNAAVIYNITGRRIHGEEGAGSVFDIEASSRGMYVRVLWDHSGKVGRYLTPDGIFEGEQEHGTSGIGNWYCLEALTDEGQSEGKQLPGDPALSLCDKPTKARGVQAMDVLTHMLIKASTAHADSLQHDMSLLRHEERINMTSDHNMCCQSILQEYKEEANLENEAAVDEGNIFQVDETEAPAPLPHECRPSHARFIHSYAIAQENGGTETDRQRDTPAIGPSLPPANITRHRSRALLTKRKTQAAQGAAILAVEAQEKVQAFSAAIFLSHTMAVRHHNSADVKFFLARQAARLLFQRLCEAALYKCSAQDNSFSLSPTAAMRHSGPVRLQYHLARLWLSARLHRHSWRLRYFRLRHTSILLQRLVRYRLCSSRYQNVPRLYGSLLKSHCTIHFQRRHRASVVIQAQIRQILFRTQFFAVRDAANVLQTLICRAVAMMTYPRWRAFVSIRSHIFCWSLRKRHLINAAAVQTLTRYVKIHFARRVSLEHAASFRLHDAVIRFFGARQALDSYRKMTRAAMHIKSVAITRLWSSRRLHACSSGAILVSATRRATSQFKYQILQTVATVVEYACWHEAVRFVQIRRKAACCLQAHVARSVRRRAVERSNFLQRNAALLLSAYVRTRLVSEHEAHHMKQNAVRYLQARLARALNGMAELGVRYFVNFLSRRIRRSIMVRRLQNRMLAGIAYSRFTSQRTAVAQVQTRIRARQSRLDHIILTRGWRRREELNDKSWLKRRVDEDDETLKHRILQGNRERSWVLKALEEEAVEEKVRLDTGEVVSSRILSQEEYMAFIGTAPKAASSQPVLESDMRLVIEVMCGKNLKAKDTNGWSDPYLTLQVGSGEKEAQTQVIKKSLDPEWRETLEVVISPTEMSEEVLNVRVFDKDLVGSDDLIGKFSLPLKDILKTIQDHQVEQDGVGAGQEFKSIAEFFTLFDDSRSETGMVKLSFRLRPIEPPRMLVIEVLRAQNLKAMDVSGNFFAGYSHSSDPYVKLMIEDSMRKRPTGHKACKTSVIKKSLDPEWNETFELFPSSLDIDTNSIVVQVWDQDLIHDDLIGECSIELSSIIQVSHRDNEGETTAVRSAEIDDIESEQQHLPSWYTIYDNSKAEAGKLQLRFALTPLATPMGLEIHVIQGRNLKPMDRGGTSDPFLVLKVGRGKKANTCKTRVIYKDLNPAWNQHFHVQISDQDIAVEHVTLTVFDKDLLSNDEIGKITMPLKFMLKQCRESNMTDIAGKNSNEAGQPTQSEDGAWFTIYDNSGQTAGDVLILMRAVPVACRSEVTANEVEDLVPMTLVILAAEGRNLKAMDLGGTSDPYIRFQVGKQRVSKENSCQTKVVKKSLNPVWQEQLRLSVPMDVIESEVLQVQVFDKDMIGSDDLIGSVEVPLSLIAALQCSSPTWYSITDQAKVITGEVLMQLAIEMQTEIPREMVKIEPQTEDVEEQEQEQEVKKCSRLQAVGNADEDESDNKSDSNRMFATRRWLRRTQNRRFPIEQLQAAVRQTLVPNVELYWSFLGKNALARLEQAVFRRTLTRSQFCKLFQATTCLQTHLHARLIRNLFLTAKVWCEKRTAAGAHDADKVMWQLLGKTSSPRVKIQTAEQHGLWRSRVQQERRRAKTILGEEFLGLHILQRAESLHRTIAAEGESSPQYAEIRRIRRDAVRQGLPHIELLPRERVSPPVDRQHMLKHLEATSSYTSGTSPLKRRGKIRDLVVSPMERDSSSKFVDGTVIESHPPVDMSGEGMIGNRHVSTREAVVVPGRACRVRTDGAVRGPQDREAGLVLHISKQINPAGGVTEGEVGMKMCRTALKVGTKQRRWAPAEGIQGEDGREGRIQDQVQMIQSVLTGAREQHQNGGVDGVPRQAVLFVDGSLSVKLRQRLDTEFDEREHAHNAAIVHASNTSAVFSLAPGPGRQPQALPKLPGDQNIRSAVQVQEQSCIASALLPPPRPTSVREARIARAAMLGRPFSPKYEKPQSPSLKFGGRIRGSSGLVAAAKKALQEKADASEEEGALGEGEMDDHEVHTIEEGAGGRSTQQRFKWLQYRKKNLLKEVFEKERDHYIRSQAALCLQQWWRIEIIGSDLVQARAKKEARRQRAINLKSKRILEAREQLAFERTAEWYKTLAFQRLERQGSSCASSRAAQAEAHSKENMDRHQLLNIRRRKANEARLRQKTSQPRPLPEQQAAKLLQGHMRWLLTELFRGTARHSVSEVDLLEDNLDRMYAAEDM